MQTILKYFPDLNSTQRLQLQQLLPVYAEWNSKINVISRKDIENFYEHHVLHSLSIAKFIQFKPNTKIIDVGTGGGFPGIPLAIIFPHCEFIMIDSIGKKLNVVHSVIEKINLKNSKTVKTRIEDYNKQVDFVISRAVTKLPVFLTWVKKNIRNTVINSRKNGVICLKGGNLDDEAQGLKNIEIAEIKTYFSENFFDTKKIVYIPVT